MSRKLEQFYVVIVNYLLLDVFVPEVIDVFKKDLVEKEGQSSKFS